MVIFVKTAKAEHRTEVDKRWGKYSSFLTEIGSRLGFSAGYAGTSIMACPYKYKQDYEREAWLSAHKKGENAAERDARLRARNVEISPAFN